MATVRARRVGAVTFALLIVVVGGLLLMSMFRNPFRPSRSSSSASPTTTTSISTPAFSQSEATALSSAITSADPVQRRALVLPELATQLGDQSLLAPGTTLRIDPSTFAPVGENSGIVEATSVGVTVGRWRLYLARIGGRWLLADTVALT